MNICTHLKQRDYLECMLEQALEVVASIPRSELFGNKKRCKKRSNMSDEKVAISEDKSIVFSTTCSPNIEKL